jgi:hypothetical protein
LFFAIVYKARTVIFISHLDDESSTRFIAGPFGFRF